VDFGNNNRTYISILAKTTLTKINIVLQLKLIYFKCTQKLWVSQLFSATHVFNVCVSVLLKGLFIQYRAFVMDLISFFVASRIKRSSYFCFRFTSRSRWYGIHTVENRLFDFFTSSLHVHSLSSLAPHWSARLLWNGNLF